MWASPLGLLPCGSPSLAASLASSQLKIRLRSLCLGDFAHSISTLSPLHLPSNVMITGQFPRKALLTRTEEDGLPSTFSQCI